MPRNTSVLLDDHLAEFVDSEMHSGRYGSESDVVRAGLELLEEHQLKVRALEAALLEGERSGEPRPFDDDAFVRRMRTPDGR